MLLLKSNMELTLSIVSYTPEYNSNFISLGQLQETVISYYNYPKCILLRQGGKIIGLTIKKKNLFIFNTQLSGKSMLVKDRNKPIYLVSKNSHIRLWHRRLGYTRNARVVEASKVTDEIDIIIEDGQ